MISINSNGHNCRADTQNLQKILLVYTQLRSAIINVIKYSHSALDRQPQFSEMQDVENRGKSIQNNDKKQEAKVQGLRKSKQMDKMGKYGYERQIICAKQNVYIEETIGKAQKITLKSWASINNFQKSKIFIDLAKCLELLEKRIIGLHYPKHTKYQVSKEQRLVVQQFLQQIKRVKQQLLSCKLPCSSSSTTPHRKSQNSCSSQQHKVYHAHVHSQNYQTLYKLSQKIENDTLTATRPSTSNPINQSTQFIKKYIQDLNERKLSRPVSTATGVRKYKSQHQGAISRLIKCKTVKVHGKVRDETRKHIFMKKSANSFTLKRKEKVTNAQNFDNHEGSSKEINIEQVQLKNSSVLKNTSEENINRQAEGSEHQSSQKGSKRRQSRLSLFSNSKKSNPRLSLFVNQNTQAVPYTKKIPRVSTQQHKLFQFANSNSQHNQPMKRNSLRKRKDSGTRLQVFEETASGFTKQSMKYPNSNQVKIKGRGQGKIKKISSLSSQSQQQIQDHHVNQEPHSEESDKSIEEIQEVHMVVPKQSSMLAPPKSRFRAPLQRMNESQGHKFFENKKNKKEQLRKALTRAKKRIDSLLAIKSVLKKTQPPVSQPPKSHFAQVVELPDPDLAQQNKSFTTSSQSSHSSFDEEFLLRLKKRMQKGRNNRSFLKRNAVCYADAGYIKRKLEECYEALREQSIEENKPAQDSQITLFQQLQNLRMQFLQAKKQQEPAQFSSALFSQQDKLRKVEQKRRQLLQKTTQNTEDYSKTLILPNSQSSNRMFLIQQFQRLYTFQADEQWLQKHWTPSAGNFQQKCLA